ncbi:MAG: hypothetical protein D6718_08930, partial [Acidobacteria bacterium]
MAFVANFISLALPHRPRPRRTAAHSAPRGNGGRARAPPGVKAGSGGAEEVGAAAAPRGAGPATGQERSRVAVGGSKAGIRRLGRSATLAVALLGAGAPPAAAQSGAFRTYTVRDGLIQSQIRCVTQDREGYLWIGTQYGLSRFDGRRFRNYTRHDGLAVSEVTSCAAAADGRLA